MYGGSCLSWGDSDPRVLTCVAIVSQSPQAWRCAGVALEGEGYKGAVPMDQVKVSADGGLGWTPTGRGHLLPASGA